MIRRHSYRSFSNVQDGPYGPTNYQRGNGLNSVFTYDTRGRLNGGYVCGNSTQISCAGGTQLYGYSVAWQGSRISSSADTIQNYQATYGYDEFNRLTNLNVTSGTASSYSYAYDRYGNRWQQNPAQSGPAPQLTFDPSSNRITTSGFSYDAAGNLLSDGINTYQYDAEGNAISSSSGGHFSYDVFNQQVRATFPTVASEVVYDIFGRNVSLWQANNLTAIQGNSELNGTAFWGSTPIESYLAGSGTSHFRYRNGVSSLRLVTDAQGNVTDTRADLAFGDGAHNLTGSRDGSFDGYAGYWDGVTAATNHAQFREYSNLAGRWMSPDPYDGSYRAGNPQSFNRYTYVLNNPLSKVDPLGLDETETCSDNDTPCFVDPGGDGGGGGGGGGGCPVDACVTAPPNPPVDPNDPFQCYACFLGSIPQPGQYVPPAQNAGAPNSGPPLPCQVQTQTALNNNLNTSAIYQAPTFQLQGQAPGFRGGNYNYNYFLPGVTQAQILQATGGSGRFSGGLHIPQPGGPDPITAIYGGGVFDGQNGSFVTAHLDSANPLDDLVSLIEHFINDVVLQRGRGGCK